MLDRGVLEAQPFLSHFQAYGAVPCVQDCALAVHAGDESFGVKLVLNASVQLGHLGCLAQFHDAALEGKQLALKPHAGGFHVRLGALELQPRVG